MLGFISAAKDARSLAVSARPIVSASALSWSGVGGDTAMGASLVSGPRSLAVRPALPLGRQVAQESGVVLDRRGGPLEGDPPAVQHVGVVGDGEGELEVLLDEDEPDAARQLIEPAGDLLDHPDPDTLGGL